MRTSFYIANNYLFKIPRINTFVIDENIKTIFSKIFINEYSPGHIFAAITNEDSILNVLHLLLLSFEPLEKLKNNNVALAEQQRPAQVVEHWSHAVPLVVRAMVLGPDTLLAAGPVMPLGTAEPAEPTFESGHPARLVAFRASDGTELAEVDLDEQPVFDGMVAAHDRVYLSLIDGSVVCYGGD